MSRSPVAGPCHICGTDCKLSFEHVPPQGAFNDRPLVHARIEEILKSSNIDNITGDIHQRGAGAYTLCEPCNTKTGKWYGKAFIEWTYQGMQILQHANTAPSLFYPFYIFPLRVIKQIVCMFLSTNSPRFREAQPELEKFVLNRDAKYLPNHINIYAFYTLSDRTRASGVTGIIKEIKNSSQNMGSYIVSEITFPPFGFLMALGCPPPDERLLNITSFSYYEYKAFLKPQFMRMPILPIYTPYPADYRSREKVLTDAGNNY